MDVLSLDLFLTSSRPGGLDEAVVSGLHRRRRTLADTLARLARLVATLTRLGDGGGGGGAIATRRNGLLAYTAATIVLGIGALAWATAVIDIWPAIDPGLPGTAVADADGGLLLWLLFGLLGSVRVLRLAGGGTMTFHMPFIGAAMVLGGPTAGAWVAFLSTIERRELESQPWYGIVSNHAALALSAVIGGLVTQAVAGMLDADGVGGAALIAAIAGITTLAVVSTVMGAATLVLRDNLGRNDLIAIFIGQIGRITAIEIALGVGLALVYVEIGWWTPLLIGGFVLMVWDNDPMPQDDELTGLRSQAGFGRQLDRGLGRIRRGMVPGATLLYLDLDRFGAVNKLHGQDVGDELLREVGRRLLAQARRLDDIAGRVGIGDELALYLPGLSDMDTAMRRAKEIHDSICSPIITSVGVLSVGVSVGVRVIAPKGFLESRAAVMREANQAMRHAKVDGGGAHLFDPAEPSPF